MTLPKWAISVARWAVRHEKNIIHGVVVAAGAAAAQPAFHQLLHGDKVAGATVIAALVGVVAAVARQQSVK